MKITDVKIHVLEQDEPRVEQYMFEIPGLLGIKFDRRSRPAEGKALFPFIRVLTDAGIEGWSTGWYGARPAGAFAEEILEAYKVDLIGVDPLDREYIWQMLWYADRFKWVPRWRLGYLDVVVSGGITGLMKVAHLAKSFGANCEVHLRGPIFGFAHAHVLSAIRNCDFFEFNPPHPLEALLVRNPLVLEDGHVGAPERPGLGVELDWDELERRTVKVL